MPEDVARQAQASTSQSESMPGPTADKPTEPPATTAPKAEWIDYALSTGAPPNEVHRMTKPELIEKFGPKESEEDEDSDPEPKATDSKEAEEPEDDPMAGEDEFGKPTGAGTPVGYPPVGVTIPSEIVSDQPIREEESFLCPGQEHRTIWLTIL